MTRRLNLHNRLTLVLLGAALLACLIAGAGLALFQSLTIEQRARQIMEPYAQMVSVGTDAAVAFEDPSRAQAILDTLRVNPQITDASIVLADGRLLASFSRTRNAGNRSEPGTPDGLHISRGTVELRQALPRGAQLHIRMGLDQLGEQTRQTLWLFGVGALVFLTATLGQLGVLRHTIVRPIAALTEAAEHARTGVDYGHRVPEKGSDEVVRLGQSFNAMLQAIHQREGDLRELSLFQRTILDNAAYGIISAAPDGMVTSFNPAAVRLLGYAADEVIGKHTPERWHDPQELVRRGAQLTDQLGVLVSPGFEVFAARPRRNLPEETEWTFIRKDGTRLPVNLSVTALHDEEGHITGFVGLVQDLSERKQAEKLLTEYAAIIESTDDAIVGKTLDGIVTSWNKGAERMLGYRASEVMGHSIDDLIPEERQGEELKILEEIRRGVSIRHFETTRRCKDGRLINVSITVSPLKNLQGDIVGASKIARDITEQKKNEDQLREYREHLEELVSERTAQLENANKELEAFSYSISHDLRAPLRHIDGFLGLLKAKEAETADDKSRHYMDTIADAAKRMGELVDDLLSFLRLGRRKMTSESVDLGGLLQEVIPEFEAQTTQREIDWDIGKLPVVMGDRAMLRVVLVNLISNAVKFTQKRPKAEIQIGYLPGEKKDTVIFVRDNGAGFDMQYVHKLFGVFQRLYGSDEFGGTGIGLANVRRIISRHGGRTWAEGKVDGGATFYFSLPRSSSSRTKEL
jgi:PAS domain S-box-containing protein